MTTPFTNQIYRHYKSTPIKQMLYKIIGIAKHTETSELMIVYKPLYNSSWLECTDFAVRPLKMFLETVTIDGKQIPRFELIRNTSIGEVYKP